jgi:hypothetical protein
MKSPAIVFAALLVAAPALADSGAGRTPSGDPASGAGRTLLAFPTIVDPNGPNSGVGRTWNPLEGQDVNSGAGRSLA